MGTPGGLEGKMFHGARIMGTSVPEELKKIYNVTDIKTVDSWKQTIDGDSRCKLDISMFKKGDKIKMSVQSIGAAGKYAKQPLIRGVPDIAVHPNTVKPSSPKPKTKSFGSRIVAGTQTVKPIPAGRFTLSMMRARS